MKIIKTITVEVSKKKLKEMYQDDRNFAETLGDECFPTYEDWIKDWIETAEFGIEDEEVKITEETVVDEDED